MTIDSALMVAGICVIFWFTGYGFGKLKRAVIRLMGKGVR